MIKFIHIYYNRVYLVGDSVVGRSFFFNIGIKFRRFSGAGSSGSFGAINIIDINFADDGYDAFENVLQIVVLGEIFIVGKRFPILFDFIR